MVKNKKIIFGLGAFRLLLAWMVIACHTAGYYDIFSVDFGTIAVSTFFFISGYLMPLTYEKNYEKYGWKQGIKKFYINRFIRIFPIYWVTLLIPISMSIIVSCLHGKWEGISSSPSVLGWFQNILLIGINQSLLWGGSEILNNPAWTLDVELQYYLLAPFIYIIFQRCRQETIFVLVLLSFFSFMIYFYPTNLVYIDRSFFGWSFFFIIGFFFKNIKYNFYDVLKLSIFLIITTIFFAYEPHLSKSLVIRNFLLSMTFISVSLPLLLIQNEFKSSNLDKKLGDFSYPTYIIHFFMLSIGLKISNLITLHFHFLNEGGLYLKFLITFFSNILLTTILSILVLRYIADPIESFRNKVRGSTI